MQYTRVKRREEGGEKPAGVYADLDELVRLQFKARGFSFLPKQPIHSLLAGRHASRLRGRGLNFEEIRRYLPGDDIRHMDWKVTARTQKAHTRVYTEERDRPVLLVVDQRLSMFFGTVKNMKSVTAAETAALAAWRVVDAGDRVGALVFNDSEIREIKPHRSKTTVMQILNTVVGQNRALGVDGGIVSSPAMLNTTLEKLLHLAKHDCLVCVISDFNGINEETHRLIKRITRHNDALIALIYDPSAKQLPTAGKLTVSDGERQLELDLGSKKLRERVPDILSGRLNILTEELGKYGVPILPIDTASGVAEQMQYILGRTPGTRRA